MEILPDMIEVVERPVKLCSCSMNHLRQDPHPGVNILGGGTAVGKAQVVFAFGRVHEEALTCRQRYPFLKRQPFYVSRKDLLWQSEPDEKAAHGVGPLHISRHVPAQR